MVSKGQFVGLDWEPHRAVTQPTYFVLLFKSHLGLGFFRVYVSPRVLVDVVLSRYIYVKGSQGKYITSLCIPCKKPSYNFIYI